MLLFATYLHIFSSAWTVKTLPGSYRPCISGLILSFVVALELALYDISTTYKKANVFPSNFSLVILLYGRCSASMTSTSHIVALLLTTAVVLSGCFSTRPPLLPVLEPIPFDSRVGPLDIVVMPIELVASVEADLAGNLCDEHGGRCGGSLVSYEVPKIGSRAAYKRFFLVGRQLYPGLSPEALAGDLAGILKSYRNVRSVALQPLGGRNGRSLLLRATVTEVSWDSETSGGGMGSTILGKVTMTNLNMESLVSSLGYARIDISLLDPTTGDILVAFPAAGTFRSEYISTNPMYFKSDIPNGYGTYMIRSAIHMAFQDATRRLAQRLKEAKQWKS